MSIMQIEDNLILDKGSEALKKQFDNYHNWCWYHGYGDCDVCRKIFHRYYIPLRKRELQIKNGLIKQDNEIAQKGSDD